jgi:hypothetical protein
MFWKQLEQPVKTTLAPRNTRGDSIAPRGFAAGKESAGVLARTP